MAAVSARSEGRSEAKPPPGASGRANGAACEVQLSDEVYQVCIAHALMTEHEEVMGLLLGDIVGEDVRIWASLTLRRSDKRRDRVEISPEQLVEAAELAERISKEVGCQTRVVGWYHSHPHITCLPSHVDLRTQLQYQGMDSLFVGLIFAVFNADPRAGRMRFELMGFRAGGSGEGPMRRVELQPRVVPLSAMFTEEQETLAAKAASTSLARCWGHNAMSAAAEESFAEICERYREDLAGVAEAEDNLSWVDFAARHLRQLSALLDGEIVPLRRYFDDAVHNAEIMAEVHREHTQWARAQPPGALALPEALAPHFRDVPGGATVAAPGGRLPASRGTAVVAPGGGGGGSGRSRACGCVGPDGGGSGGLCSSFGCRSPALAARPPQHGEEDAAERRQSLDGAPEPQDVVDESEESEESAAPTSPESDEVALAPPEVSQVPSPNLGSHQQARPTRQQASRPPATPGTASQAPAPVAQGEPQEAGEKRRCTMVMTRNGGPCLRWCESGYNFCWQHKAKAAKRKRWPVDTVQRPLAGEGEPKRPRTVQNVQGVGVIVLDESRGVYIAKPCRDDERRDGPHPDSVDGKAPECEFSEKQFGDACDFKAQQYNMGLSYAELAGQRRPVQGGAA